MSSCWWSILFLERVNWRGRGRECIGRYVDLDNSCVASLSNPGLVNLPCGLDHPLLRCLSPYLPELGSLSHLIFGQVWAFGLRPDFESEGRDSTKGPAFCLESCILPLLDWMSSPVPYQKMSIMKIRVFSFRRKSMSFSSRSLTIPELSANPFPDRSCAVLYFLGGYISLQSWNCPLHLSILRLSTLVQSRATPEIWNLSSMYGDKEEITSSCSGFSIIPDI